MPEISTLCDNCGLIVPSGIYLNYVYNTTFHNNKVSCPNCGSDAVLRNDVYEIIEDILSLTKKSSISEKDIENYRLLFIELRSYKKNYDTVRSKIEDQATPLKDIVKGMPEDKKGLNIFLGLLIAAISWIRQCASSGEIATVGKVIKEYNKSIIKEPNYVSKKKGT